MIDPKAVVDPNTKLDPTVKVGPFAVIGPNVSIGAGSEVGAHAIIDGYTTIGENCQIYPHAAVGLPPQDLKYKGEKTTLEVGDRTIIREFATLNPGTEGGGGATRVGNDCLLMAYSHVAHDCQIGNNVIMANACNLAGHVTIEDHVIVGGLSGVHQFVKLGQHSIIGGSSIILMDIPPYTTASGNKARLSGLNLIGLKRRGFSKESIAAIRKAYRMIFQSNDTLKKALAAVRDSDLVNVAEVNIFIDFLDNSERGVTR